MQAIGPGLRGHPGFPEPRRGEQRRAPVYKRTPGDTSRRRHPAVRPVTPAVTLKRIDAAGYPLAASLYGDPGSGTVAVISAATGVPQYFYKHLAAYLAGRGWAALTYDYRGIGESAPDSLRGFDARMRDWALIDMNAAYRWVNETLRPQRLFAIGHSFGGQALGLLEQPETITAAVGVSAQSGYWGVQAGNEKYRVRVGVTVFIPVLARLFGYLPWSWFASGEDLPKGVALEWARWCRDPDYLLGDDTLPLARYRNFVAPLLSYSIDDDDWGSPRAVDSMMRAYRNVTRAHIVPGEHGIGKLGHSGFFRKTSQPLWHDMAEWLDAQS